MQLPSPFAPGRILAGALFILSACAGPEPIGPAPDENAASIRVSANVAGTPIDNLVVTVSAADLVESPVFNIPAVSGMASGTVLVPAGLGRTFAVTAFDDGGEITHEGQAVRDVVRGQNPPLTIALTPRAGHVPLTITFGDYSVVVTPSLAAIDLSVSSNLQLSVSVTDAANQSVPSPLVQWATTDPSRARVDQLGNVTGLLVGAVDIVATYNGIAGVSHLTVENSGLLTFYGDADGDGFGDSGNTILVLAGDIPPTDYIAVAGDCDDTDFLINPGQFELPGDSDGKDNDCDGLVDEVVVWVDNDLDGFGDSSILNEADPTAPIAGWAVAGALDCNDNDSGINPGATEILGDGIDQDCDGFVDET